MADDVEIPDESEQLDQLQADDTLVDRGVDDVLDEGYTTPENWSPAQGFGNTAAEMREGETLEQRMKQEIPDPDPDKPVEKWNPDGEKREVGSKRAGRLVDVGNGGVYADHESESVAQEVGIDGGAAPAEEAAVHVIDPTEDVDDEDE
ncbi:DUF5709 domain-containing protein [Luteococcus sp. H138]|uniref:DUF5709 domain-containing protein n=1 Tax=unclassified Luteococcus TaxID=2639923 RepID=UPI00313A84D2